MLTPGVNRWGQRLLHFGTSPAALVLDGVVYRRNATLLPAGAAVAALYYQVRSTAGRPALVRQKRDYFTRPVIEAIERLRCRMPGIDLKDVAQRLRDTSAAKTMVRV
jgi:hypothetical protein